MSKQRSAPASPRLTPLLPTEIEIRPATQLIQQLSSKDEAAQLDAAEHITAVCFKLRGQEYRDFQDSLKPALQLLTEMVRRPNPLAPP